MALNDIAIIIPTLDRYVGVRTGRMALEKAGCDAGTIVVSGEERGFTKTVNDGFRMTKYSDVCIINDDILWFQDNWLVDLRETLYSNSIYGLIGPSGKSGGGSAGGTPDSTGIEIIHNYLSFFCVLVKREVIDTIGILDEKYIHYYSDVEYCNRIRDAGWKVVWRKDVWLNHSYGGSGRREDWARHDSAIYYSRSPKIKLEGRKSHHRANRSILTGIAR